jgi:hypothetical protein
MATNTFKKKIKQKGGSSPKKGWNLFAWMEEKLKVSELFGVGIPVNLVPPFLYAASIALIYIWSNHRAENTIRKIEKVQQEVEDLRADVTTLEAEYMLSSKQSEVARKIEPLGLQEIDEPPIKIKVSK